MTPMEKLVYTGLGVYVLAAAAVLWSIVRQGREQNRQRGWPRVRATVLEHRLRGDALHRVHPEMRVRYETGGEEREQWVGSADRRGAAPPRESVAQSLLDTITKRHPAGSTLEVMVNPANPYEACLVERKLSATLFVGVVAALFVAGFLFLVWVAREFLR